MKRIWLVVTLAAVPAWGQFAPPNAGRVEGVDSDAAERMGEAAKRWDEENRGRHGKDGNYLVLPGVLANRTEKTVRLFARATGILPSDPLEFFIIPADSGKDYEALAVAFARPSDVHKVLEFIGMKPGRPVSYFKNHLWPKGERVVVTYEWEQPPAAGQQGKGAAQKVRAERLVIDTRSKKTLGERGLVFTGSYKITPEEGGEAMYAADVADSKSIASDYNDKVTVLDVPWQWPQGEVYGFLKANPEYRFAYAQAVQIVIEPVHKDLRPRVRDLKLGIAGNGGGVAAARFVLTDGEGKKMGGGERLPHLLAEFERMHGEGLDPFVTITPDGAMTLQSLHEIYALIQAMDKEGGVKVETSPEGHLFYRAFFPREEWRDRNKRLGRPWELQLNEKDGKAKLILSADEIDDNGGRGDLVFPVGSAEELAKVLAEKSDRFSQTVYIFAAPEMKYGALMELVRPAMKTHPTMYVFLAK